MKLKLQDNQIDDKKFDNRIIKNITDYINSSELFIKYNTKKEGVTHYATKNHISKYGDISAFSVLKGIYFEIYNNSIYRYLSVGLSKKIILKEKKKSFFGNIKETERIEIESKCYNQLPIPLAKYIKDYKKEVNDYNNFLDTKSFNLDEDEFNFLNGFNKIINDTYEGYLNEKNENEIKLKKDKDKKVSQFDKDGNGKLDTIEVKDDFDKLVKKHQSKIIKTDRSYIQHFVKVSNYQKQKRKNLQSIFESIRETRDQKELSSQVELLKEQIHSYELLLFHSLNMVTSLVEDDMFTFYEIYESFDKLEIFNSNHENEVSKRLKNIEGGIGKLITSIRQMEESIISELGHLSYVTQDSYDQLSNNVTRELESINSSIKTNNLLTGINAYQTYKLRKGS
jgi:hypothetical protein